MSWRLRGCPVMAVYGQMAVCILVLWSSRLAGQAKQKKLKSNDEKHFLIQCGEPFEWTFRECGENSMKQTKSPLAIEPQIPFSLNMKTELSLSTLSVSGNKARR